MAQDVESRIKSLLRPTEELVNYIEISHLVAIDASAPPVYGYLAVITHLDELTGSNEGSVFVVHEKKSAGKNDLDVWHVFPIVDDFSIAMSQDPGGIASINLDPASSLEQHKPSFTLTISTGLDANIDNIQLTTSDILKLRETLDSAAQQINAAVPSGTYSWISPYLSQTSTWDYTAVPQDLRVSCHPLHERISKATAGTPGDEVADVHLILDDWLRRRTQQEAKVGIRTLRLRIGTFNVNGKMPSQDLSSWLRDSNRLSKTNREDDFSAIRAMTLPHPKEISPLNIDDIVDNPLGKKGSQSHLSDSNLSSTTTLAPMHAELADVDMDPDLIVLGFQELDLSTEALLYSYSSVKEDAWLTAIFASLGEKAERYEKLCSKQLVGMLLIVLIRKDTKPLIPEFTTSSVGSGIMGFMGNKGAVGVRLHLRPQTSPGEKYDTEIHMTTLTFVNSHLAAFDEMFEKRNQDYRDISSRLTFAQTSESPNSTSTTSPPHLSMYETDAVFWLGGLFFQLGAIYRFRFSSDLNYRLEVPDTDVRYILSSETWKDKLYHLLQYDQLRRAIHSQSAFTGFNELNITHLPSYRFSPGIMTDALGYDTKRKPAWCDRILHMHGHIVNVNQLSYTSHPLINQSDHHPVSALFDLEVDSLSTEKLESSGKKLRRRTNGIDDLQARSHFHLSSDSLDFGTIRYNLPVKRSVRLSNKGKVARAFRFVALDPNSEVYPKWLKIQPMTGLLLPDEVMDLTLTACVTNDFASEANLYKNGLNATLILHILMGKDHFINVSAAYEPTCFAAPISILTRLPGPIRSSKELLPEERATNAPREVMRLVNWLMSNTSSHEALFINKVDESVVETVIECLDTGEEFPFEPEDEDPKFPVAFGEVLLRLLDSFPESIIPASMHSKCAMTSERDEAFEVLDGLSPASVNIWISLTAYLHYVCESSANPQARAEFIASTFSPILLKEAIGTSSPVSPLAKRNFVMYFIT